MFDHLWHKLLGRPYRLHTARHGGSSRPVIVLLHGIGASSEDWRYFLPLLEKDYHCITIDLLGCGQSPKPQWSRYSQKDHIASLRYTIKRLKIKKFSILGHSLGGLLATKYATVFPEGIERLILLSPPVYPEIKTIRNTLARQRTNLLLTLYRTTRKDFVTPELFSKFSYILPPANSVKNNPNMWIPTIRTLENCIENQTILEDISHVNIPIDIWYGALDEVVIAQNVKQLIRSQPNCQIHSFGGRHFLTKEYAKTFANWLL